MSIEDIIGLCVGVPALIALISLMWYCAIKDLNHRQSVESKKLELEERKVIAIEKYVSDCGVKHNV